MLITVNFHKAIRKYTNYTSKVDIYVDNYFELLNACYNLFPDFERLVKHQINNSSKTDEIIICINNKVCDIDILWMPVKENDIIILIPIIYGGGKIGRIIAVIAIIAIVIFQPQLVFVFGGPGIAGPFAGAAISITGLTVFGQILTSIAFSLISSLLQPSIEGITSKSPADAASRRNNDFFDGLTNTLSVGTIVSLNYGLVRVSGHFVSGYVETTFTVSSTPDSTTTSTTTPSNTSNPLAIFSPFGVINDDLEDRGGGGGQ